MSEKNTVLEEKENLAAASAPSAAVELDELDEKRVFLTPGQMVMKRFFRNRLAVVGLVILVLSSIPAARTAWKSARRRLPSTRITAMAITAPATYTTTNQQKIPRRRKFRLRGILLADGDKIGGEERHIECEGQTISIQSFFPNLFEVMVCIEEIVSYGNTLFLQPGKAILKGFGRRLVIVVEVGGHQCCF